MLLVWGRKWYTRKLGFVADFCEICRRPQPFTLERRSLIGHFWYLPMGTTHSVHHRGRCTRCASEMGTELLRYTQVARKKAPSTRELLASTLANHEEALQQRLHVERVVRDNVAALSPAWRRDLLLRPFVTLSPMVERRFASMRVDAWIGAALASILVLPALGHAVCAWLSPDNDELGGLVGLGASVTLIVWAAIGAQRRWIRQFVAPRLVDSLAPLRASDAEIEGILAELRANKHKLGKSLRLADLRNERAAPSRPSRRPRPADGAA